MERVGAGGGKARCKPRKLTMEDYILFLDDNKAVDLTIGQLNQIIHIHGYKKLHKTPKNIISEALGTMELVKPTRSTLLDADVSSQAVMYLDDVIKELGDLDWQECCVTSLQMLNSVDLQRQPQPHLLNGSTSTTSCSMGKKHARRQKSLNKLIENVNGNAAGRSGETGSNPGVGTSGSESASRSYVVNGLGAECPMKLATKRKRSMRPGGSHSPSVVGLGPKGN